jgi:hypothetical protein
MNEKIQEDQRLKDKPGTTYNKFMLDKAAHQKSNTSGFTNQR